MDTFFEGQYLAGCQYAKQLTLQHHSIHEGDIQQLRDAGFSDGEILEINQVTSYFNYVNRTVVGLGGGGGSDAGTEGKWIWDGDSDGVGSQFWNGGPNGNPVSLQT